MKNISVLSVNFRCYLKYCEATPRGFRLPEWSICLLGGRRAARVPQRKLRVWPHRHRSHRDTSLELEKPTKSSWGTGQNAWLTLMMEIWPDICVIRTGLVPRVALWVTCVVSSGRLSMEMSHWALNVCAISQGFFEKTAGFGVFSKPLGLPLSLKMMLLFLHLLQRKGRVQWFEALKSSM